jgi:hypothetical protein
MPLKKRIALGRVTSSAKKKAEYRASESIQQREARLEDQRIRQSQLRESETPQQARTRLQEQQIRQAQLRASETTQEVEARLEADQIRHAQLRASETPQQARKRLQEQQIRQAQLRASETPQEAETRLQTDQIRHAQLRASETPQQTQTRLKGDRNQHRQMRAENLPKYLSGAAFNYNPNINYHEHQNVLIGKMEIICPHCAAYKWKDEPPGMCCSNGKVKLTPLFPPPDPLGRLMLGTTSMSKHFLENIRRYNSCFQMTSFGATREIREPGFMPTFKVQG